MTSLYSRILLFLVGAILFSTCSENESQPETNRLFRLKDNATIGIDFINKVSNSKDFNIFNYRNFYNGGGVAIGDINNDGLADVFLSSNMGENKLYLNQGDWKFEDISKQAGIEEASNWSTGVVMVDINADGLLDIYVCNAGYKEGLSQANAMYINQGDLSFKELGAELGLAEEGYTTHAAFFDYDLDGDLDVYLLNNSFIPVNTLNYNNKRDLRAEDWDVKDFLKGGGDKLLRNENGRFVDVSEDMGIYGSLIGFGLGVTIGDINNDNYPDIYVSNDFFERDYLYVNKEGKFFEEELEKRIDHLSHSSMGADMADINNDGTPEIFVTDMLPDDEYRLKTTSTFDNINLRRLKLSKGFYNQFMHNTLQLNSSDGQFSEISYYAGVAASDWSWGALMLDADNDGFNDIFVCNGIYHDVIDQDFIDFFANEVLQEMALSGQKEELDSVINHMPSVPIKNKAFRNSGSLYFDDVTDSWGFDAPSFSNGAAYGDLDNDGDYDLVINNVNQDVFVYENNSDAESISFKLEGKGNNTLAIGSRVYVYSDGNQMMKELIPSRGFQSSVDYTLIFGLGNYGGQIDSVLVKWPNGLYSRIEDYSTATLNVLKEADLDKYSVEGGIANSKIFELVDNDFIAHSEDDFIDFYFERNIPNQLSKEGPCSAVGDVNGDGQMDIYIGGADGQSGRLYVYGNGRYRSSQDAYFDKFKALEETAACFFDADGDGDLDLAIGAGGNNVQYNSRAFTDRLFINDGGVFELKFNALPPNPVNTSVIAPFDFDKDGDLDLFVGNRSIPGLYGLSPGSRILRNNGYGQFVDVTEILVPELLLAGMITDAAVSDILENPGDELLIVGEWMSPKLLAFNGQSFDVIESNMDTLAGLWQSVKTADLDNDGDMDLVLGNIGENFYLKANMEEPLRMWINDYDGNNSVEKIITRTIDGRDMPVVMKRDITDQLASLKKQNLKHSEYATKSIHELFDPEVLRKSTVKQVNFMKSICAINNGAGQFDFVELPVEAQLSCVNEIVATDYNQDGLTDLVLGGNNHYFLPQFSMLDACKGKLLKNKGQTEFEMIANSVSGFNMRGVVRSLQLLDIDGQEYILALINNDKPQLYKMN